MFGFPVALPQLCCRSKHYGPYLFNCQTSWAASHPPHGAPRKSSAESVQVNLRSGGAARPKSSRRAREERTSPSTPERRPKPSDPLGSALRFLGQGGRHRSAHGAAQKRGAGPSAPVSRRSRLATRKSQSGGPQTARGRRAPRDQRERDRWTTRRAPRVDGGRSGALWGGGEGRARGGSASGARCSGGSSGLRDACESGIGDLKSGRGAPGHKLPRALRAALEMGDDGVY